MNKPIVTLEEALARRGDNNRAYKLLTEENGCTNGCRSGITEYSNTEFPPHYGAHDDQEGFYVLEGSGFVKLGDEVYEVKAGDSFVALPGVRHTLKSNSEETPLKVFWFHSAI